MNNKIPLLKIKNLKTFFPVKKSIFKRKKFIKAVNNVSLNVYKGETLGIVGESGCGKSTLGKSILQLIQATEGSVEYLYENNYIELTKLNKKELDNIRKKIQIIFQDPYSSLNPSLTIFQTLQDPLIKFTNLNKYERRKKISELLNKVNMPEDAMDRYPNEFSGGQRQRIDIARALSVSPELIICDEAVSALDVSIQAQVLKLLNELKEKNNLTYIFITHDLSVIEYLADRIAVMYLGQIVELADTDEIFSNTLHPYTKALLNAIPVADVSQKKKRSPLKGDVPSADNPPSGCHFHTRCPECKEICKIKQPMLINISKDSKEHFVACHLYAN